MKKLIAKIIALGFSVLFLSMISSESFAQTATGTCSGTPTITSCTQFGGNTANCTSVAGCAMTSGACGGTITNATCVANTTSATCAAIGCQWLVSGSSSQNAFVTTLCNVLKIVTGTGGKAFAAFAIISVGIGFFTGKVSWGLMIGVTCGIAAMFGAPTIVAAIGGGSAIDCTGSGSI